MTVRDTLLVTLALVGGAGLLAAGALGCLELAPKAAPAAGSSAPQAGPAGIQQAPVATATSAPAAVEAPAVGISLLSDRHTVQAGASVYQIDRPLMWVLVGAVWAPVILSSVVMVAGYWFVRAWLERRRDRHGLRISPGGYPYPVPREP